MTLLMDIFEPRQIKELLEQSMPVSQVALNSAGYADYEWVGCVGQTIQVERKQIDELLSGLDKVEEQLRREVVKTTETILVYEGTFEPMAGLKQACHTWKKAKNGRVMIPSRTYNLSYSGVQAWFYQLDKAGITVYHTSDYIATAIALGAWYNSSQKQEHTTLKRYIKEHIYPEPFNPHIHNLMALKGAQLGEAKAKALIDRFGTFWWTINQTPECLAETLIGEEGKEKKLGMTTATKLLQCIGRLT